MLRKNDGAIAKTIVDLIRKNVRKFKRMSKSVEGREPPKGKIDKASAGAGVSLSTPVRLDTFRY